MYLLARLAKTVELKDLEHPLHQTLEKYFKDVYEQIS